MGPLITSEELEVAGWRAGEWNHVTAIWSGLATDGNNGEIYLHLNGEFVGDLMEPSPMPLTFPASAEFELGAGLAGEIDDLLIYAPWFFHREGDDQVPRPVRETLWPVIDAFPATQATYHLTRLIPRSPSAEIERVYLPWLLDLHSPESLQAMEESQLWRANATAHGLVSALQTQSEEWGRILATQILAWPELEDRNRYRLEDRLLPPDAVHPTRIIPSRHSPHIVRIRQLEFLPGGERLRSIDSEGTAVWYLESGDLIETGQSPWSNSHLSLSEVTTPVCDGAYRLSGDHAVRMVETESGQLVREFRGPVGSLTGWTVDPAGERLLLATAGRQWPVQALPSGEVIHTLVNDGFALTGVVALSADGRWAAAAMRTGDITLFALPTSGELH